MDTNQLKLTGFIQCIGQNNKLEKWPVIENLQWFMMILLFQKLLKVNKKAQVLKI